jgi:cation-transporting ATPase 13A3/4/5
MQPQHKAQLIEYLQSYGYYVGMCGDGANDCGALKAAFVGLSLSDAEASIAAPFTSKVKNISAMVTLLLEGRCCLCTNVQCFKFIALYSVIQFVTTTILYHFMATLVSLQYFWVDCVVTTTLFTTMAMSRAADRLSIQVPPDSLFTKESIISILGLIVIQTAAQFACIILLVNQEWYDSALNHYDPAKDDNVRVCQESTSLFLFSVPLLIASCITYNISHPFKEPNYKNIWYTISLVALGGYSVVMYFVESLRIPFLEMVNTIPMNFLVLSFVLTMVASVLMYAFENILVKKTLKPKRVLPPKQ